MISVPSNAPVERIKTGLLVPPWIMLRPVMEDSIEFMELTDSIKDKGILNSILVRPHPQRPGYYEVIDGMWRFSVGKLLDLPEIPAIIRVGTLDNEVLELQIHANAVRYETNPIDFADHVQRMIRLREEAGLRTTMAEIGALVGKRPSWVNNRLKLLYLTPPIKRDVREGKLCLGKAMAISRIDLCYQDEFYGEAHKIRRAKQRKATVRDFELAAGRFILSKEQKGIRTQADSFMNQLTPRLQRMDDLLTELDTLENVSQLIVKDGAETAQQGAKLMLEWVLNLHDASRIETVRRVKTILSRNQRLEIIGRQRYAELDELRKMREERNANGRQ